MESTVVAEKDKPGESADKTEDEKKQADNDIVIINHTDDMVGEYYNDPLGR